MVWNRSPSENIRNALKEFPMSDLIHWINKQVANELIIQLSNLRNLSQELAEDGIPTYRVGDEIEFEILLKNNNPFPLGDLEILIHEVEAVEFQGDPIIGHIQSLAGGEQENVAAIRGKIRANPDDARSAWRTLDKVCRVTITGEIDLPPIEFHDEEFEVVQINNA
jgi:uncharacterized membrane protein